MDNKTDMNNKLQRLEELLQTHDWYYNMSDDHRYYLQGRRQYNEIWRLMDELKDNGYFTEAENLYDKYKK
tara:strand:- start:165 stop:374 length:210 start_codon:yes stop_codon:yes gene_type:complete